VCSSDLPLTHENNIEFVNQTVCEKSVG